MMNISQKIVSVRGKQIGGEQPCICTPVVGASMEQILLETEEICRKGPDIIEWRADFFKDICDTQKVLETALAIRKIAGEIPILFTVRSEKEGGNPIPLTETKKIQLLIEVCKSQVVDMIDYELLYEKELVSLRQVSKEYGIRMIMSYHNFSFTPQKEEIVQKMLKAESYGADIAKVAVMPTSPQDLLVLFHATQEARSQLSIPLITMSMGGLGVITRLAGWMFGSAVTFAVGQNSSAPGQIPIEDLKDAIRIVQKYMLSS
ncbi:3-dehydroquinate dehydratase [Parageobacillus caldoxylosilyticus NBRC 107762]|uniref:3-dehydroquinate dehydratase n=2 Tax=Saccharococcus caldoxylosilyticus TaxID=81408 RepID=A0A023DKI5_9BACL|nr:3-dehydroquinate dehydratase-1 [Parageobacillus caldoxylosilyticus]GAJ41780.1 3-dehydroquinate dehydratase [Parageobacillus caldoxylosilyticus NBRC 107762]